MGESAVGWANCRVGARASRRGVEGRARWLEGPIRSVCCHSVSNLERARLATWQGPPKHRCRRRPACLACLGAPRS